MSPADITAIAGLIPSKISLHDERDLIDYITLLICPALNMRATEAEASLEQIKQEALAIRLTRAA